MADNSKIEWTDTTWNPLRGCAKVSEGCRHCYAEKIAARFSGPGMPYEGTITNGHWNGQIKLVPEVLEAPLRWKKPRRIFVNSMSDLFHENVPDDFIDRVFAVMSISPQHTFQILTKRPERMMNILKKDRRGFIEGRAKAIERTRGNNMDGLFLKEWPLPNVWLGVSIENQETADERIPLLLETPAAVRFLSVEPLLGQIDLRGPAWRDYKTRSINPIGPIDWIITGGESGPGARPMHPDWARSIRDQCKSAGVPFFFKQWGEFVPVYDRQKEDPDWRRCDVIRNTHTPGEWLNLEGGTGFHGANVHWMKRVGKKAAGRLLDGVEHNEFPEALK